MVKKISKKARKTKATPMDDEPYEETQPILNQSFLLIKKLKSLNYLDREDVSSILSSHSFDAADKSLRENLSNLELLNSLVQIILDPYTQIRFNALTALHNLITAFSEFEMDLVLINQCGLFYHVDKLFKEYFGLFSGDIQYTESELSKLKQVISVALDLLNLIVDLSEGQEYEAIDYTSLIDICQYIISNPANFSEENIIKATSVVSDLVGIRVMPMSPSVQALAKFGEKIVLESSDCNPIVYANFVGTLVYFSCVYPEFKESGLTPLEDTIGILYGKLSSTSLFQEIEIFSGSLTKLCKSLNEDTEDANTEMEVDKETGFKNHVKTINSKITAAIKYLKIFNDIVTSVELKQSTLNQNPDIEIDENLEDEEYEEISEEAEDKNEIEKLISNTIGELMMKFNYQPLQKMLNLDFLKVLVSYLSLPAIEEFMFKDFDKLVVLKENIVDLEYYACSVLSNLLLNVSNLFPLDFASFAFGVIFKKLQFEECHLNAEYLTVVLATLRNLFENTTGIEGILANYPQAYKSLVWLIKHHQMDKVVKITVLDIIAKMYIKFQESQEESKEICELLWEICMNEQDIEVLSHVLNGYFDVYAEDYNNGVLVEFGIIEKMKGGLSEFKNRLAQSYSLKLIDKEAYKYCKETFANLKRFIKYKEKMFGK